MANQYKLWWLQLACCFGVWSATWASAGAAEKPSDIQKIVFYKGIVYTCTHEKTTFPNRLIDEDIHLHSWLLDQSKPGHPIVMERTADPNIRWTVAHDSFWSGQARTSFMNPGYIGNFTFGRLKFDPEKGWVAPRNVPGAKNLCYGFVDVVEDLTWAGRNCCTFPPAIYYDYQPVSATTVRMFLLTNIRAKIKGPLAEAGGPLIKKIDVTPEDRKKPNWSLTIYTSQAALDKKEDEWLWDPWKKAESLPVLFEERFQVVAANGETYFFITASGKVYISKKPEKGKKRTMEAFWTDKEQRVIAFVTDADQERTFVFTKNQKQGEKNVYFELTDKPKPLPYNLADVKPPKEVSEPLKTALPYANILLAAGKIKVPKPKE